MESSAPIKAMLDLMAGQRNAALDQAVTLVGELALASERILALEAQVTELTAKLSSVASS